MTILEEHKIRVFKALFPFKEEIHKLVESACQRGLVKIQVYDHEEAEFVQNSSLVVAISRNAYSVHNPLPVASSELYKVLNSLRISFGMPGARRYPGVDGRDGYVAEFSCNEFLSLSSHSLVYLNNLTNS